MSKKKMHQLHDIPKKQFFTVPEDYFADLPARIQSRTVQKHKGEPVAVGRVVLRYAFIVAIIIIGVLYYRSTRTNLQTMLASIETEELIDYLQDTGMSTDELLETVELTAEDVEVLEDEIYLMSFGTIDESELAD